MRCDALEGKIVLWRKDGTVLQMKTSGSDTSLLISSAQQSDEGIYTCDIINSTGEVQASYNTTLRVKGQCFDNSSLVSRVPSNKCLGLLLDEKLTFETHIDYICKKACAGIGALRRIKPFVPLCTLVTLYRSLIEPYFDYCSPLWDTCGKQLKDKLQKIQNRAGRVITGSSYDVRSVDVLNNLNWKTLETRRFHTKATLMYKILNDLSAPQLSNSFVKLNDININYNLRNI